MAQMPGAKLISAFFFLGPVTYDDRTPTLVHFELRLLRFEGLSPLRTSAALSLATVGSNSDAGYDRWALSD